MKNIIITGSCEVEVLGVSSLLEGIGIPTLQLRDVEPEPGDLLIVSISAEPLLGWAKFLPALLAMKLWWRCSMVVVVPNKIASVRLLDVVGSIVSGGCSLAWTRNALMYLVMKWRQDELLPVGDVRRFSVLPQLSLEDVAYFFALTLSVKEAVRLNKTEYGRRNRAVSGVGFCNLHRLKLFMAGVDPKMLQALLVPLFGSSSLQAVSCECIDISQYANADASDRYFFSADAC